MPHLPQMLAMLIFSKGPSSISSLSADANAFLVMLESATVSPPLLVVIIAEGTCFFNTILQNTFGQMKHYVPKCNKHTLKGKSLTCEVLCPMKSHGSARIMCSEKSMKQVLGAGVGEG